MKFNLKQPCVECPFRCDIQFYLDKERKEGIVYDLRHDKTFPCHMTDNKKEQHCAGALIILVNNNELLNNYLYRLAIFWKMLHVEELDLEASVARTFEEWIGRDDR